MKLNRRLWTWLCNIYGDLERSNYVQCVNVNSQSTIHNLQSTIHNSQSIIHNLQFTVHNLQSTIHNPQSTIHNPQSTIRSLHPTIHILQSTSYNPQSTIHKHSLPRIYNSRYKLHKCEQQLTIYNLQFTITASEVTQWWYIIYVWMLLAFKCALISEVLHRSHNSKALSLIPAEKSCACLCFEFLPRFWHSSGLCVFSWVIGKRHI